MEDLDALGAYTDHVVLARAEDAQRSDCAWQTEAQLRLSDGYEDEAVAAARNYWSGEPFHDGDSSVFEWRAKDAVVIRAIDRKIDGADPLHYLTEASSASLPSIRASQGDGGVAFAIALHRKWGWRLLGVAEGHGGAKDEDRYRALLETENRLILKRAFAVDGEMRAWDVRGVRPLSKVIPEIRSIMGRKDYHFQNFGDEDRFVEKVVSQF